ncbi:mucin-2 [Streptomyces sp. NPDC059063]|uniref:mucin-2 n=1 Tax=Streptomyces sp. NPDC059063 TaxID=3346712 RepID=UPI0036B3279E
MYAYATAQNIGTRSHQCDATAVRTGPDGTRAFALLDGIGSDDDIRDWTRAAARRLAGYAVRRGHAEEGLRTLHAVYAAEEDRQGPWNYAPCAAAVVAVAAPGKPLSVAWCGDSRAYLLGNGVARRLTEDHNLRRVWPPTAHRPDGGNRNRITSCLGSSSTDESTKNRYGHPAIEAAVIPLTGPCRLLLASDGAYEPHTDAGYDVYTEADDDDLKAAATGFVEVAVAAALAADPTHADNATALVADLTP